MDPTVWLVLAGAVAILLAIGTFLQRKYTTPPVQVPVAPGGSEGAPVAPGGSEGGRARRGTAAVVAGGIRRHQPRNVRARLAAIRRARGEGPDPMEEEEEEEVDGEEVRHVEEMVEDMVEREEAKVGGKVGTKKLKRIQEKAERKAMREQEEALRVDRKRRETLREEERKMELEEEKLREQKEEEEERLRKEEEERREQEEYMKLKETFTVEEEGLDAKDDETQARGVGDFIEYIKKMKVVYMEDLAAEFELKTQDAIARVQSLQKSGKLSGVVDDRGKFIFISEEELQAVADFIKQRGRVSIAELVSSSNRLINLQPQNSELAI